MSSRERRKRYLVKRGLQFKYLGLIGASIILPTFLLLACLYYLIFSLMAEQLGIPESIAYNLMPVFHKINAILLVGMPLIVMVLLFLGVLVSHRIVGPLYRLERELEQIAEGDFTRRIKIRRKDELFSIAEGINKALDKILGKTKHA